MAMIARNGRLGACGPAGRRCHGLRTHGWTARHGTGERAEQPHAESSRRLRHTHTWHWHTHTTSDLAPRHPLVVVASAQRSPAEGVSDDGNNKKNGVFSLLLINFAVHIAATSFAPGLAATLALSHLVPRWWQFVTAAFVHASWDHLFGNAFSLLVFGRMVEEEEGAFGLWATYVVCGIAGNVASYLSAPHTATVSLGASSSVFGLFAVGVLTKVRLDVRRMLEAVVLGGYVWKQVMQETAALASGGTTVGGMSVGHWAHLGGAVGGVLLVLMLSRLPKEEGD